MHLSVGEKAPAFAATDIHGKAVSLKDFAGSHILLCFYRYAGCPFCNLSLKEVIAFAQKRRQQDLKVVAFFQSSRESVLAQPAAKLSPPFPLVADQNRSIYDAYGVETSYTGGIRSIAKAVRWLRAYNEGFPQGEIDGNFFLMPAQFLISPAQEIELAYYWKTFGDETPFAEIEKVLG